MMRNQSNFFSINIQITPLIITENHYSLSWSKSRSLRLILIISYIKINKSECFFRKNIKIHCYSSENALAVAETIVIDIYITNFILSTCFLFWKDSCRKQRRST